MKLGEYIELNNFSRISVAKDENNIDDKIVFDDISVIPVKYWNAELKTVRHKLSTEEDINVEFIAIIKLQGDK